MFQSLRHSRRKKRTFVLAVVFVPHNSQKESFNMSQAKIHIMVDIETLDVTPSAVILSIGAVTMPQDGAEQENYYVECNEDQPGRTVSQDTIDWWKKQSSEIYPKGTVYLRHCLLNFRNFIFAQRSDPVIWCKGTDFDVAILSHAFKQYDIPIPWKYNAIRDMRTLKKVSVYGFLGQNPVAHNALEDARHQAKELQAIFQQNPSLVLG
jgi:DNA polymerase III epsilon subunit-like protein